MSLARFDKPRAKRILAAALLLCMQDALFSLAGGFLAATAVAAETGARADGDAVLFAPGGEELVAFAIRHSGSVSVIGAVAIPFVLLAFLLQNALRAKLLPALGPSNDSARATPNKRSIFFPFLALALLGYGVPTLIALLGIGVGVLIATAFSANPMHGASIGIAIGALPVGAALLLAHATPLAQALWLHPEVAIGVPTQTLFSAYTTALRVFCTRISAALGLTLPLVPGLLATIYAMSYAARIAPPAPYFGTLMATLAAALLLRLGRAITWDRAQAIAATCANAVLPQTPEDVTENDQP